MAKSVSTLQRGFTLIEMSIVLVIIGLIIGGILKGQELIESSRQKNLISQIDRLRAATTTFVDRFKSLPGDFNRITLLPNNGSLTAGNADGIVGADSGLTVAGLATGAGSNAIGNENVQFFNHLLAVDLTGPGTVSSVAPACFSGLCATSSMLPPSAFPNSGLFLQYGSHPGAATPGPAVALQAHWLLLSRFVLAGFTGGATDGVVSPARAFQIDNKYDDGTAGGGNIRTSQVGAGCGVGATDYVPTDTAVACNLMFTLQ